MTARIVALDHAGVLGGAELSLLDVCAALGADVRVRLFADGPFREALERRGIAVRVTPMGALAAVSKQGGVPGLGALHALWTLAGDVARDARGARLLYANSQKAFVAAAFATLRGAPPLVWHLRDLLGAPHFGRINTMAVVRLANARAVRVIANSQATANAFVTHGGARGKVRVVHNGIDAAPFDAVSPAAASELRARHAPSAGQVLAVFGRVSPWKGQDAAIRALAMLPVDTHLWIIGAPLFGEEAWARDLQRLAAELGLASRVWFAGFRDDIPVLMKAADIVVHASTLPEPFGRVLVEGMLAGRPVIATSAGGVPEIVRDGVTGLLVPPDDASALAAAALVLRHDPSRAAALAAAGAARARAVFSVTNMVRGVRAVLDEVLA
jgi:glycosyltransferase involved in cell wall biosynthesis